MGVMKEGQQMIRTVTAVDVAPGHEDAWEEAWRALREARGRYPGFRGARLLRDSTRPMQYLVLSEWTEHAQLAEAMRGLGWLNRDQMAAWTAGPTRVYDEVVDAVGDVTEQA